jgi:hypothetical protein
MTNESFGSMSGSDEQSGPVSWPVTPFAEVTDSNGKTVPHDQPIRFTTPNDDQPIRFASPNDDRPNPSPTPITSSTNFKKLWFVVGGLIGALLLMGGGAFAYFGYYQSPDRILRTMLANLSKAKTLEYESDIRIEGSTSLPSAPSFDSQSSLRGTATKARTSVYTVRLTGSSDISDPNSTKNHSVISLSTDSSVMGVSDFGVEFISMGKDNYVKAVEIASTSPATSMLSSYENRWIKIDVESLAAQFGVSQSQSSKATAPNPDQIERKKETFRNADFFAVTKTLPGEKMNGVDTYHYRFIIDRDKLRALLHEFSKIDSGKEMSESERSELDSRLSSVTTMEGEVWVGKWDRFPYKLLVNLEAKDALGQSSNTGKATLTFSFKNFNKPVTIEAPADVITIEELLSELQTSSTKDTDGDGLMDSEEASWGTDIHKADSDDDGYSDSQEIKNGYNPAGSGKLEENERLKKVPW